MRKRIISLLLVCIVFLCSLTLLTTKTEAHEIVMTSEEFIDCLWTAYNRPNVYRNVYPYNLGYYDGRVIYFDCWNLGKAIIWSKGAIVNNYTVGHHAAMDTSCGLGDWDGLTIVKAAPNCSSDFSNLVPGEWLYMDNHTGYYVGNGQVIECTAGWNVWAITVSQIDRYGNRSRNGVSGGSWKLHGMVPWLDYESSNDKEKPVISDVQYSEVSAAGYTISCKVTDNASIKRVAFPTWTTKNGQDDLAANFMSTQTGTKNGDRYTFRVNASDHRNETGEYITHIYAEDRAGNITSLALNGVQVRNDTQKPIISDVQYSEVSAAGYTISCKVIDDWGVSSVSFPTWTIYNGQDDLPANFLRTQLGTKNGNRYTFRVNASAHNNETGEYATHIYATDCAGNQVSLPLETVQVMNDRENPVISDAKISNVTPEGYTVSCTVTDNWGVNSVAFPTWTDKDGQDDLPENFLRTQLGKKDGNTYTFQVKASDHNNELGVYTTHIYATDCAGNQVNIELKVVMGSKLTLLEDVPYVLAEGFVTKIKAYTTVSDLLACFDNQGLEAVDGLGNILMDTDYVGTGTKVNLCYGDEVLDTVTVVVLGDLDGNGIVDTTDYMRVKSALRGAFDIDEAQRKAADTDENDKINAADHIRLKSYFMGTHDLNP